MGHGSLILLDTHAWLWWSGAPEKLGFDARRAVREASRIGIPSVSCLEVATLSERGRIKLDRPVLEWIEDALAEERVELVPLTPSIAVTAARLRGADLSDPVDRVIAATAIELQAMLVTKDDRLRRFPAIRAVWS